MVKLSKYFGQYHIDLFILMTKFDLQCNNTYRRG